MLLRKFSWLYRCADWRYRDFFAAENIKEIKSFRAKKFGFNISGNYSGRSWMRVNVPRVALGLYQIWKTKTGKTPCAWCKMALTSHWYCDWLRIPRASSGIFSRLHHPPCRVLHPAQGDKQKKLATVTIVECSAGRMDNSVLFAAVNLIQSWKG